MQHNSEVEKFDLDTIQRLSAAKLYHISPLFE